MKSKLILTILTTFLGTAVAHAIPTFNIVDSAISGKYTVREEAGRYVVKIARSDAGFNGKATVYYFTSVQNLGSPAQPDKDFKQTSGSFTWESGDGSEKSFTITLMGDYQAEYDEHVYVWISDRPNTYPSTYPPIKLLPNYPATLNIIDDDAPVGDVNRDCVVNTVDAELVKAQIGKNPFSGANNVDRQGGITNADLALLMSNMGKKCKVDK